MKVMTIGGFTEGGAFQDWKFDRQNARGQKEPVTVIKESRRGEEIVCIGDVEIVPWTRARQEAMGLAASPMRPTRPRIVKIGTFHPSGLLKLDWDVEGGQWTPELNQDGFIYGPIQVIYPLADHTDGYRVTDWSYARVLLNDVEVVPLTAQLKAAMGYKP